MTGGEAIVSGLVAHGVDTVFGLPGAQIYGLFDAFHQAQLKVIGARHEQACGYMAYGYARSSGRPGVFTVVPGPGVLNAGAAMLTAFGSNEPVLCLTGQVPTHFSAKAAAICTRCRISSRRYVLSSNGPRASNTHARTNAGVARVPGNAVGTSWTGRAGNAVGCVHAARGDRHRKTFDRFPAPQPDTIASRTPPR